MAPGKSRKPLREPRRTRPFRQLKARQLAGHFAVGLSMSSGKQLLELLHTDWLCRDWRRCNAKRHHQQKNHSAHSTQPQPVVAQV